jgi:predicted branched-subunit amino acid permease
MLTAFSNTRNRYRSLLLLLVCGVFAFGASILGIEDNPPGIALAFLSTIAFILALVHPWRTSKQFRYLIYGSGLGFVISAILHNVLEGIASKMGGSGLVHTLLSGAGVAFFFIALVCPIGLLVGLVGALIMSRRKDQSQSGSSAA